MYDTVVIGGGPAGLTAGLYLARYHLAVCLIDSGHSRAALIPKTHNQPFWSQGIGGVELLEQMRLHAARYPIKFENGIAEEVRRVPGGFEVDTRCDTFPSRTVLIATGVENLTPSMTLAEHSAALMSGLLRYCPICDGYEVTDQIVAVVGKGDRLFGEAKFLRSYSSDVTVFSEDGAVDLADGKRDEFRSIGVDIIDRPVLGYTLKGSVIDVDFGGRVASFDTMYAALGSTVRSAVAVATGVRMTEEGCVVVDAHQRTNVPGLYAAGDVVVGVDQIAHAMGQATVAATAIRNDLCAERALLRSSSTIARRTHDDKLPTMETS